MDLLEAHLTEILSGVALAVVVLVIWWLVVSRRERREFGPDISRETVQAIRAARRSGESERLHHGINARVTNFRAALYRDFPDPVRELGDEAF